MRFIRHTLVFTFLAVFLLTPLYSDAAEKVKKTDDGYTARKAAAWSGHGRVRNPDAFGDVLMGKGIDESKGVKPVIFSHLAHRVKYTCSACHSDSGYSFKAGKAGVTHSAMEEGKFCATCHNDRVAFAADDEDSCTRCHSSGLDADDTGNSDMEELREPLPEDDFGNRVNWVKALRKRDIKLSSGGEKLKVLDTDIIIPAVKMTPHPPDVKFPHKAHTEQLTCANCHPSIFKEKAGGNKDMHMLKIIAGQYCGTCHGTVSFPLEDCFRCHSQPAPPVPVEKEDEDEDESKDKKK